MNTLSFLDKVSALGIEVQHGSANRAWAKAAYLFVEHYVVPVVPAEFLQDKPSFVEDVILQLIKHLMQHYGNQMEKTNTPSTLNSLPTRKCFISVNKLAERYCMEPVHSCIDLKAFGKNQLEHSSCDWIRIPGILIGFIEPDENHERMIFRDRSGSMRISISDPSFHFVNTVSFLLTWNYIPATHSHERYIEVIDQPLVLHNFKSTGNDVQTAAINTISLEKVNLLKGGSMEQNLFDVSGYVFSVQKDMPTLSTIQIATAKSYGTKNKLANGCLARHTNTTSIFLDGKHDWLSCLSHDDFVTITHLRIASPENDLTSSVISTTPSSRLILSTDSKYLLQQYEQGRFENFTSQQLRFESTQGSTCRLYVGRISDVESESLRVVALDSGSVIVLLTGFSCFSSLGFRVGALISIKSAHICQIDDRIALVCCESSTLKVIEHSKLPTPSCFPFHSPASEKLVQRIRALQCHPSRAYSLIGLCRKLVSLLPEDRGEDGVENIMKQEWFLTALFPAQPPSSQRNSDSSFSEQTSSCCDVDMSLKKMHFPFVHISLKMVRDASVLKARAYFSNCPSQEGEWKCVEIQCSDIKPSDHFNHEWTDSLVCIAMLSSSQGCFELSNGQEAIRCLVLPRQSSLPDGTTLNSDEKLEKNLSILCTKDKGCLVRIVNFRVIVERKFASHQMASSRSPSFPDVNTSSPLESVDAPADFSVYMVAFAQDIVLLKSHDSSQCLLGCTDGPFMQTIESERQAPEASILDTLVADKPAHREADHLLFIVHKGPLQSFPGEKYAFHITALRCNKALRLEECHLELKGSAASWYPFLHVTMMVRMVVKGESKAPNPVFNLTNCSLEHCYFVHVHNFDDIASPFTETQILSFYHHSYKTWKINHFSRGIDQMHSVADLVTCPPSSQSQLVAVRGEVQERIEFNNDALTGTEQRYLRITLAGSNNYQLYVYVQLRENCTLVFLGVVPGAVVDFYRVKLVLSAQGEVYCKYTATSFHLVRSINVLSARTTLGVSRESQASTPGDQDAITSTLNVSVDEAEDSSHLDIIGPTHLLYDLYTTRRPACPYKVTRLKVFMTRLLHVELSYVRSTSALASVFQPFPETNTSKEGELPCSGGPTQRMENNVAFAAKSIVSDGSGRAILHFGSTNQTDFCKLAEIEREEWNDIINLLRQSVSGSISYDCDLHDGKESLQQHHISPDHFAQKIAVSLFNDINSRALTSREILVRRRLSSRKRPWKNAGGVESFLVDDLSPDSMFKIGTVPIESHGNSSLKSLALRLLQFNCLSVL